MVTLKQLAKELNVSISTVSKALNNSEEIGEETVKRVKELAELYNYKPNKVALSLKSNKTKTIGVIIPDILNYFLAKVLFGIEREATLNGYNIITCISNESLEKEINSLQLLANGSVDGFIMALSQESQVKNEIDHLVKTISKGLPIVMFDRVANDVLCDKVIVDNFDSTYHATKRLIADNRKQVAFLTNIDNLSVGKLREKGYMKAIAEYPEMKPVILKMGKNEDAQEIIMKFFNENKQIDGIISADDASGFISINVALNLGYKVPKDVSVISFASISKSNHSVPKLSIIRQQAKEIGANAAQLLIQRLQNKVNDEDFSTRIIKTEFIKAGSSN